MTVTPKQYRPHFVYIAIIAVGLVLSGLLVREFWLGATLGALPFLAISLGLAVWGFLAFATRVEVTPTSLTVYTPLRKPTTVEFRQLIMVAESGRLLQVISLLYYPRQADGLLTLDTVASLHLPALRGQAELLAQLQTSIPS
jgi:hypothetical protein